LLATDLQQSVLAELDRSGPNHLAYNLYGAQISRLPAGSLLGFNGQLREQPTGWYHLGNGHRVYNPLLMRFHSPDRLSPFGKGGINAYAYCGGDPINFTDPSGQFFQAISQVFQRAMTILLHIGIPSGLLMAPRVTGVALLGTRASIAGSVTSAAGAGLQLAGVAAGTYVSNAGITLSVGGLFTRVAVTAHRAYQQGTLWTTIRGNLRNVLGMSGGTPAPAPSSVGAGASLPMSPITPSTVARVVSVISVPPTASPSSSVRIRSS
jgi:RHS repeat-associated protein